MKIDDPQLLFEAPRARCKRKPELPGDAEFRLQCAVVDMLRKLARPGWNYFHIPLGELRTIETGRRLKRMGTQAGMFDLLLISPSGEHIWMELKASPRGKLSPAQLDFEGMLCVCGIRHATVRGFDEAEGQLREWGVLRGYR